MNGGQYLPLTEDERREMLDYIGIETLEELFWDVPGELRIRSEFSFTAGMSEPETMGHLRQLAEKNANLQDYPCFLGGGVYDHYIPAIVHHLTGRSEFYTSYTPYQGEVSQGLLQAIFEYQTLIARLTGMEISNASLYDGATALAEAALMACRITRRSRVLVSETVSPHLRQVLQTYMEARNLGLEILPRRDGVTDLEQAGDLIGEDPAALVLQTPNHFGAIERMDDAAPIPQEKGGLLIAVVDPVSLALLRCPGEYGADIAVGEGQVLGNPPSFGGPLLGFLAARQSFLRNMPGRLVGETVDAEGNRGFVMTLQTREQHIRRQRATSNICTNQALNALAAAIYMVALGPQGLREVASACLKKSAYLREKIAGLDGFQIPFARETFFKEFPVQVPGNIPDLKKSLWRQGFLAGIDLGPHYPELERTTLLSVTENRTRAEMDALVAALEGWK